MSDGSVKIMAIEVRMLGANSYCFVTVKICRMCVVLQYIYIRSGPSVSNQNTFEMNKIFKVNLSNNQQAFL